MADDPKKPPVSGAAPLGSSAHVATRRTITGSYPVPSSAPRQQAEVKPTIAEALRETADAVQEAVRELTGQHRLETSRAQVAILTPTAAQIRAADLAGQSLPAVAAEPQRSAAASAAPAPAGPMAQASSPQVPSQGAPGGGGPAGPGAAKEMVTLKIDGHEVTVPKGTNVLDACIQHGVDISFFCYHAGLSSPAVCRQCLVEIVGQPKLVPSCYTPVADKMEVLASSDKARLARQQMLEFTLVNHPVDCPICDKAGECTLQKLYMEWDGARSRTDFEKVHKPKVVDLGPTIVLDAERCILCTRCIRVCDEVAGEHQLEMAWRGDHEVLTVAPGKALDNPYSLNTVDVCPVGALTSKDFRFKLRAWELYTVDSVCPGCATGCNVEIHHGQGEIWRLVPRENQEVNKFWMCDEGRFTYKEVRQRRIAGARFGQGGGLPGQVASVEKAVTYAAERLGRIKAAGGPIGLVFSAQAQNEALYALGRVAELLSAQGCAVRKYVVGRAPRPERQDKILRSADVNPNTAGALLLAGPDAGDFAALVADLAAGALQALWLVGEDMPGSDAALAPLLAHLDRRVQKTDERVLKLIIVQAVHDTLLTQRAQVILPAAAWAEVDGTFTNNRGRVQRIRRAVNPPGDARSHLELVSLLSQKLGLASGQGWQGKPRQAFQHMMGAMAAGQPPDLAAPIASTVGFGLRGLTHAEWGRERPPLQLRFAHSRG